MSSSRPSPSRWLRTAVLALTLCGCAPDAPPAAPPLRSDGGVTVVTADAGSDDAGVPVNTAVDAGTVDLPFDLREVLRGASVASVAQVSTPPATMVALGRALMFDKVLSGRRDTACATCHLTSHATSDGLTLAFGTGSSGAGPARTLGGRGMLVPRHSMDLFNRALLRNEPLLWDGRVGGASGVEGLSAEVPARPQGLQGNLAMQALLPLLSREEMRGLPGELDVNGQPNELGELPDDAPEQVWAAVMARVLAIPEYVTLLRAAYPQVQVDAFAIHHLANALAAFQTAELVFTRSPLDAFLAGDDGALSAEQKRGGELFVRKGNCLGCHTGPLLSNFRLTSVGVPQLGPGRGAGAPLDLGVAEHTGRTADRFHFRVPSLRNVALTAPYMHNGAFATLEAVVRHYNDIPRSLQTYDASQLHPLLQDTVRREPALLEELTRSVDGLAQARRNLSDTEVAELVSFLEALTDPAARELSHLVPTRVPSGLPVGD